MQMVDWAAVLQHKLAPVWEIAPAAGALPPMVCVGLFLTLLTSLLPHSAVQPFTLPHTLSPTLQWVAGSGWIRLDPCGSGWIHLERAVSGWGCMFDMHWNCVT